MKRDTESSVCLAVAEALSLVIRGIDADVAVELLLDRTGDDDVILGQARDRCLSHDHVPEQLATSATDLLATAAMTARGRANGPVREVGVGAFRVV